MQSLGERGTRAQMELPALEHLLFRTPLPRTQHRTGTRRSHKFHDHCTPHCLPPMDKQRLQHAHTRLLSEDCSGHCASTKKIDPRCISCKEGQVTSFNYQLLHKQAPRTLRCRRTSVWLCYTCLVRCTQHYLYCVDTWRLQPDNNKMPLSFGKKA